MISFAKLSNLVQQVLAPPYCVYCKKFLSENTIFCDRCMALIQPIVSTQLAITPTKAMTIFALCRYEDPIKPLILAKASSQRIAGIQLGHLLWQHMSHVMISCDYVVPIPLHWTRYARRGFNQAEVIAKLVAQKCQIPCAQLLKRIKMTPFQSRIAVEQRLENVKHAFALTTGNSNEYEGKNLMLIDDLMTTGATLQSAAKILLPLKPASINALVVCRVC